MPLPKEKNDFIQIDLTYYMKDKIFWAFFISAFFNFKKETEVKTFSYFFYFFFSCTLTMMSQGNKSSWIIIEDADLNTKHISESGKFSQNGFLFDIEWDNKLTFSENHQIYYGGILFLKISNYKNQLLTTIESIKDSVGLGDILISFFDFNLDGLIDFRITRDCGKNCYFSYYFYDNESNQFIHKKDWDYIRINKVNKREKLISLHPDGNNPTLYRINGYVLEKVI